MDQKALNVGRIVRNTQERTEMQAKRLGNAQEQDCVPAERTEMQTKRLSDTQEQDCVPAERTEMQTKPPISLFHPLLL